MLKIIKRHPLPSYFFLVFFLEWILSLTLFPISPILVGLFALLPAPVAFMASTLFEGKKERNKLSRRVLAWRNHWKWYLLAFLIPVIVHLLAVILAVWNGTQLDIRPQLFLMYLPLTLILAAGEEIGWQGYAMPKIRRRFSPFVSAVIFGLLHGAFHLPMYLLPLPAELRQASPFPLFMVMVIAFSFYRVWFFDKTRGNVPLMIVHHAVINLSALLLNGADRDVIAWVIPVVWLLAGCLLLATGGLSNRLKPGEADSTGIII